MTGMVDVSLSLQRPMRGESAKHSVAKATDYLRLFLPLRALRAM